MESGNSIVAPTWEYIKQSLGRSSLFSLIQVQPSHPAVSWRLMTTISHPYKGCLSLYPAELLADFVQLHWGDDVKRAGVCPALVHLVKSSFELKFHNPDLGTPTNFQNYRSDYLVAGRYLWTHHTTQQKAKHQDWKLENTWVLSR